MKTNTIGRVADRAGISVETVRYYERQGLIQQPDTPPSGFREYPEDTVQRILFIRRGKELGFTLQEISELLNLRVNPKENCDAVRLVTQKKIEDVDRRIKSLEQIRTQLQRLANACDGTGETDCAILEAMN
ncbi:MAG: heavy metal-responsive transcriptional regulator [Gemmatimonadales bacterium]